MSVASVTFYNIRQDDPCLTQNSCSVCLEDVAAENGKAHTPTLSWYQQLVSKKPPQQHAIHKTCLEDWIRIRLNSGLSVTCPTCRGLIVLPLKDRVVRELTWITKHAILGATIQTVRGLSLPVGLTTEIPVGHLALAIAAVLKPEIGIMGIGAVLGIMGAQLGPVKAAEAFLVTGVVTGLVSASIIVWRERENTNTIKLTAEVAVVGLIAGVGLVIAEAGALAGSAMKEEAARTAGAAAGVMAQGIVDRIFKYINGQDH